MLLHRLARASAWESLSRRASRSVSPANASGRTLMAIASELRIAGTVDFAHPARTNLGQDPVATESCSGAVRPGKRAHKGTEPSRRSEVEGGYRGVVPQQAARI